MARCSSPAARTFPTSVPGKAARRSGMTPCLCSKSREERGESRAASASAGLRRVVSTKDGVVCVAAVTRSGHYAEVFLLRWEKGELKMSPLASLPKPCASFCGALLGTTLYVAGGIETPGSTSALRTFWSLDLGSTQPQWQELETLARPARMLAVAAVQDKSFYLASGVELSGDAQGRPVRRYLNDAYRYQPGGAGDE